jgi:hypothetical protein
MVAVEAEREKGDVSEKQPAIGDLDQERWAITPVERYAHRGQDQQEEGYCHPM